MKFPIPSSIPRPSAPFHGFRAVLHPRCPEKAVNSKREPYELCMNMKHLYNCRFECKIWQFMAEKIRKTLSKRQARKRGWNKCLPSAWSASEVRLAFHSKSTAPKYKGSCALFLENCHKFFFFFFFTYSWVNMTADPFSCNQRIWKPEQQLQTNVLKPRNGWAFWYVGKKFTQLWNAH